MPLNVEIRRVRLADGRRQEVNARYMRKEQYDRLVANIREDGCLTSVPLWYQPDPDQDPEIISGHHRGQAAIEALGPDAEADVMVVLDAQSLSEIRARQISHNSIEGEDDLATLKQMYEEIDDIDWREYSGIDDKTLELMDQVDLSSLAEPNLDYVTVQVMFLPDELEKATAAFDQAKKLATSDEKWLAYAEQYEPFMTSLHTIRNGYKIGSVATALMIMVEIFERHMGDVREGWYDEVTGNLKTQKPIDLSGLFGFRMVNSQAAGIIAQAIDKVKRDADIGPDDPPWKALELMAADYLAGP